MQQATDADRESYAELLKYGSSVIAHLASIRGRPVNPPPRSKLLGVHDARRVTESVQKTLGGEDEAKPQDPPICYIFRRAPPCQLPLDDLKKVRISDLRWSEVHRGEVIVVRSVSSARRIEKEGGVVAMVVEDEHGSALILRLFNFPIPGVNSTGYTTSPVDDVLPPGVLLAVKEPYCEAASESTSGLRVDHPSDVVLLDEGHILISNECDGRRWWKSGAKNDSLYRNVLLAYIQCETVSPG